MTAHDLESELPEDFDELSDDEKAGKLRELASETESDTDAGAVRQRILEELARKYSNP